MLHIIENVFLKLEAVEEVLVEDDIFSDCLHGINLLSDPVLNKENFAKGTFTNHFFDLKILKPDSVFSQISFLGENEGTSLSHGCTSCRWLTRFCCLLIFAKIIVAVWFIIVGSIPVAVVW
jgi:hypothetical protein